MYWTAANGASSRRGYLADEPQTLEELAIKFNVSRERIRQIEARAFEKVRKAAKARAAQAPAAMLAALDA